MNNPASTDVFDSQRQSASLQNDITLAPDHLLTVGFDYYKDLLESNLVFAETSRDNKAGFAAVSRRIQQPRLDLGCAL